MSERMDSRVWSIAAPIILANLSTPLLGAVDTAVVGFLSDPAPIGAVGIGAAIFSLIFWGFGFLRQGTSGFAAQAFGAGDTDELRATLARPMILAIGLGLSVILLQGPIGFIATEFFDPSPEVRALTEGYYGVRIWSAPATLANYVLLAWLISTQRALWAMLLQVTLNGTNIVLDLLFVVEFGWGVEGVALASVIAELIAMALGLAVTAFVLGTMGGTWRWPLILERVKLLRLFRVNADIFVRNMSVILAFAYFTRESARMDDIILAANHVLMQFLTFAAYGLDGFAHAVEVIAGGAVGAGNRQVFRRAVISSTRWAAGFSLMISILYALLGNAIINLFTDLEAVTAAAGTYLPWLVALPIISVWSFQLDGIFIGATRSAEMRNAMLMSLAVYLPACWLLIPPYGNHGLWLAMTVFMAARAITLAVYYPRIEKEIEPEAT